MAKAIARSIASGGGELVSVGGELGFHLRIGCTLREVTADEAWRNDRHTPIVAALLAPRGKLRGGIYRRVRYCLVSCPRSAVYEARLFDANAEFLCCRDGFDLD
jgi:hypothetical protein